MDQLFTAKIGYPRVSQILSHRKTYEIGMHYFGSYLSEIEGPADFMREDRYLNLFTTLIDTGIAKKQYFRDMNYEEDVISEPVGILGRNGLAYLLNNYLANDPDGEVTIV